MARHGVRFGAHTCRHERLSRMSAEQAQREIAQSKEDVEMIIGESVTTFAYPNGRKGDFTDANVAAVRACGFRAAATTFHGANTLSQDPFMLRRIGLGDWAPAELALRMS